VVLIETSMGNIKMELYPEKAPKSAENFLKYTKDGFFKDTIFHRVMPGFVIQGGGFTKDMSQKTPTYAPILLESQNGLKNSRGTVAMARTSQPNSATCQFYINLKDNLSLDYNPAVQGANGYAVFGKVIEGLDVVDKIAAVATATSGNYQNVPVEPVLIKGAKQLP
jgi:cyclophilin family peptidyl-prolyl cis-trans isomerase